MLTQVTGLLHALESGTMRLELCMRYRDLLEDVRQDLAAALTALSGMIWASSSGDMPCCVQRMYAILGRARSGGILVARFWAMQRGRIMPW